jgi:hypothetical protein
MATDPDGDMVTYLDAQVGSLTDGTNLFRGKMRGKGANMPSSVVFCLATGGDPPMTYIQGTTKVSLRNSMVQVLVRSPQNEFGTGQTLARTIRDTLHAASISGYIGVRVNEAEPNQLYEETSKHFIWTLNVEMKHEQ